jgi:hypothetical protein
MGSSTDTPEGISTPPLLHGVQRKIRHIIFNIEQIKPFRCKEIRAYSEQVGKKRHPEVGFNFPTEEWSGEKVFWYPRINNMKNCATFLSINSGIMIKNFIRKIYIRNEIYNNI